jgi:hypothetical protein
MGLASQAPRGPPSHQGKVRVSLQDNSVPGPSGRISNRPRPETAPTCSTVIPRPSSHPTTVITSVVRTGPIRVGTVILVPTPVVCVVRNSTASASPIHSGWEPRSASSAQTRSGETSKTTTSLTVLSSEPARCEDRSIPSRTFSSRRRGVEQSAHPATINPR